MTTNSFVHSSISTTADEANDFIAVYHPNFALVANIWSYASIHRICRASVDFTRAMSKHTKRGSSSRKHDEVFETARLSDRPQCTPNKESCIHLDDDEQITRLKQRSKRIGGSNDEMR
jgi:hypothetical protein